MQIDAQDEMELVVGMALKAARGARPAEPRCSLTVRDARVRQRQQKECNGSLPTKKELQTKTRVAARDSVVDVVDEILIIASQLEA